MQIVVRHGLSNQIPKINERINELNQNKETYDIESFPSETWNSSSIEIDPEWYALFNYLFVLDFALVSRFLLLQKFLFHSYFPFFCGVPCVR